jgi:hypothetical protein
MGATLANRHKHSRNRAKLILRLEAIVLGAIMLVAVGGGVASMI